MARITAVGSEMPESLCKCKNVFGAGGREYLLVFCLCTSPSNIQAYFTSKSPARKKILLSKNLYQKNLGTLILKRGAIDRIFSILNQPLELNYKLALCDIPDAHSLKADKEYIVDEHPTLIIQVIPQLILDKHNNDTG